MPSVRQRKSGPVLRGEASFSTINQHRDPLKEDPLQISKLQHEKLLAAIEHEKLCADSARAAMKRSEEDAKLKVDLLHEVRARDQMTQAAILRLQKGA